MDEVMFTIHIIELHPNCCVETTNNQKLIVFQLDSTNLIIFPHFYLQLAS